MNICDLLECRVTSSLYITSQIKNYDSLGLCVSLLLMDDEYFGYPAIDSHHELKLAAGCKLCGIPKSVEWVARGKQGRLYNGMKGVYAKMTHVKQIGHDD